MKKTSTVQLVRNATLKIRYAGHTMLIDPVLADKGTLISALGVNKTPRVHLTIPIQDIIGGVDMVLLTHNHIDHYEPSVPTHLPKEIPFYVQPQDADAIRNDGFTNVIPIEEIKTIDGFSHYYVQSGDVEAALKKAALFAAFSVTGKGTQSSYPSIEQFNEFLTLNE